MMSRNLARRALMMNAEARRLSRALFVNDAGDVREPDRADADSAVAVFRVFQDERMPRGDVAQPARGPGDTRMNEQRDAAPERETGVRLRHAVHRSARSCDELLRFPPPGDIRQADVPAVG